MNIPYFLKKIFEEYNSKKINDQEYLQTCIENYTIKEINPELVFFCYTNNVLLEMLYNINLVYSYITNDTAGESKDAGTIVNKLYMQINFLVQVLFHSTVD